jgi:hypothetical protein
MTTQKLDCLRSHVPYCYYVLANICAQTKNVYEVIQVGLIYHTSVKALTLLDIIVIILSIGWKDMDLIHLAYDGDTSCAPVNTVMELRVT